MTGDSEPLFLGILSGTSADAVDVALVAIPSCRRRDFRARLLAYQETPLPADIRERIHALALPAGSSLDPGGGDQLDQLLALDRDLGRIFLGAAHRLLEEAEVSPSSLSGVGLHGQTVRHRPPRGSGELGRSLQIGGADLLVEELRVPVVWDFRSRDMALGGQGAPLVPLVDRLLLEREDEAVAALNLGGIANLTWLPPSQSEEPMLAFDTGPANTWIDAAARAGGLAQGFDPGGERARRGELDEDLLRELLAHPFFQRLPPKSTGLEEFDGERARSFLPGRRLEDVLHTLTQLTVRTVGDAIRRLETSRGTLGALYVSGGGRRNDFLMELMAAELPGLPLLDTREVGVPGDSKEAFAFAVLAARSLEGLPGNVPEVTGATRSTVLGSLLFPSGSVPSGG